MRLRKWQPIETEAERPEEVRVVRSPRTLYVCAAHRVDSPKDRLGRMLLKFGEMLRKTGLFGSRAL